MTVTEFRAMSEEMDSAAGWARAKRLLANALAQRAEQGARIDIGWVSYLADGLCRKAFSAAADVYPDRYGLSGDYVILLPLRDAEPEFDVRARFEAWLLDRLAAIELPFRPPRLLGLLPDAGRPALVETFVTGIPLDLRAGRQLGDPAYDLAIVTRGARQPFQIAGGLDRLLESYAGQATEIKKDNVHLYELCLLARWYRESLTGPRGHPSAELLNRLRGHFRRTVSAAA
jgi:hypothetical protein